VLELNSSEYIQVATAINTELQGVYNENIKFFKRINHPYFSKFVNYRPKRLRLKLSEKGYVNLYNIDTNHEVYPEDPCVYAEKQALKFLKLRPHYIVTASIPDEGYEDFPTTELFLHINKKYEEVKPKYINAEEKFVEQLFMYGAGLCLQLQPILNNLDVKNLTIFEPDLDALYNSLYVINWEQILGYFNRDGYSLMIYDVFDSEDNLGLINSVLNKKLVHRCTKIDIYSHYENKELKRLSNDLKHYFINILATIGFFEDERNGLKHSIKNFISELAFANCHLSAAGKYTDIPVLIVGNGPSLDKLENFIRLNEEKFIIISCGTALGSLLRKGIHPDIHIEQERDKVVQEFLLSTTTEDIREKIFFIGLSPCFPDVFSMFERKSMVLKPSDSGLHLLRQLGVDKGIVLNDCNPLVSNFGLSLAVMLGFKDIYLAGVDCGMIDLDKHHSEDSFYFTNEHDYNVSELYEDHKMYPVKGNLTEVAFTNVLFNQSKLALERVLAQFKPSCYNLSDGVFVQGSVPLKDEDVILQSTEISKTLAVSAILEQSFTTEPLSQNEFSKELEIIKREFLAACVKIEQNFQLKKYDYVEISKKFDKIELILINIESDNQVVYRLLNGSIKGIMINVTAARKILKDDVFEGFYKSIKPNIDKFFNDVKKDIREFIY